MDKLKSYSCPECGSFLEVDRYEDVFDCPFCGTHFNVLDFHRDEILGEARELIKNAQTALALEKYEYLLSIETDNFELLYEYTCAVDGAKALKTLSINADDPHNTHERLRLLLANDKRFTEGKWADYYAKLYEVLLISNKYHELQEQYESLNKTAIQIKNEEDTRKYYGFGAAIIGIAGFLIVINYQKKHGIYYSSGDIRSIWPVIPYAIILAIAIGLSFYANIKEDKRLRTVRKHREERYNKIKEEMDDLNKNEIEPVLLDYKKASEELKSLEPDVSEMKPSVIPKLRTMNNPEKNSVCAKCGGELKLDHENKLLVCSHCGVSYDYSGFVGAPGTKAKRELMDKDFDLAEKRYARVLAEDPGDFEANRGMILCAGKWRDLPDLRLNDSLKNVDWVKLDERLEAAKTNTNRYYSEYFNALDVLLKHVKNYYFAYAKPDKERVDAQNSAAQSFRFRYKELAHLDRQNRIINQNRNDFEISGKEAKDKLLTFLSNGDFVSSDTGYLRILKNHPDDAESLRGRILCTGRWTSVEAIDLKQDFSRTRLDLLDSRIKNATEDAPEEYHQFFDTFAVLNGIIRDYFGFSEHGSPDKERSTELSEKFIGVKNTLVAMDNELFGNRKT